MKLFSTKVFAGFLAMGLLSSMLVGNTVTIASVALLTGDSISIFDKADETQNQTETVVKEENSVSNNTVVTQIPVTENNTVSGTDTPVSDNSTAENFAPVTDGIDKAALEMFKMAVKDVKNGASGYTKKHWQAVSSPLNLDQAQSLSGMLTDIMTEIMITEDELKDGGFLMEKGSDDARNNLADYSASIDSIKSVTRTKDGENTVVTIIMKDSLNPQRGDADGLSLMSTDLLYIEDVRDKINRDGVVSAIVKDLTQGDITYKEFKIEATLNKEGKIVKITHYCDSYVEASADTVFGTLSGDCGITFYAEFYDFTY